MKLRKLEHKKDVVQKELKKAEKASVLRKFKNLGAKVLVGAAMVLTVVGVAKCGSDAVEKPPIEEIKDANGSSDVTETKDTGHGKDVETDDDVLDAGQLPDVQPDIGQEDVGLNDVGPEAGPDVDIPDGGVPDAADVGVEDTGSSPDVCNEPVVTNEVTRDEQQDIKDAKGNAVPAVFTFTDERDTQCGELKVERKNLKVKMSFSPALDGSSNDLAIKSVAFNLLGQVLELQQASASELVFIMPRVPWNLKGPFNPAANIAIFDDNFFQCIGLWSTENRTMFELFAGPLTNKNVKLGEFRCREDLQEPTEEYVCAKWQTVDMQKYGAIGYITGVTAENRGVLVSAGMPVQTKLMFSWQVGDGQPVLIDNSEWLTTAVDVTSRKEWVNGIRVEIFTISSIELQRK